MVEALETARPACLCGAEADLLGQALATSSIVALAIAQHDRIVFANTAFHALFLAHDLPRGTSLRDFVMETDRRRMVGALRAARRAPAIFSGTCVRHDKLPFEIEMRLEPAFVDGAEAVLIHATDVTEQHRSQIQLSYLAYSDALTGLPNRALFADRLRQTMLDARRYTNLFALMVADLDGFKAINDTYGHDAGDTLLQLVAQRLQSCIRGTDTVARLGGDEFAVLLPRLSRPTNAAIVAGTMVHALREPFDIGDSQVTIGISIGIAVYPEHANNVDLLLAAADTAVYRAKREGRHRYCWATMPSASEPQHDHCSTWGIVHRTGVKEIDEQHERLARLTDVLATALKDGSDRETIHNLLAELVRYAEFHFAAEERLMAEHEIVDSVAHQMKHRCLLDDLRHLSVDQHEASVSLTLRFLQEWLVRHVDKMDKPLGLALNACGIR